MTDTTLTTAGAVSAASAIERDLDLREANLANQRGEE
jgi:hypothetical protein